MNTLRRTLHTYFERMSKHYGPTHWWPGDTPFEIAIGAILTQNTAWTNVEKAIANLKRARLLSARAMLDADLGILETALRPSGYFRQKAIRVRLFCQHLTDHYGGSMTRLARRPLPELREELLALKGIGPETADDILLYACDKPVFVVDAYTRRIFSRHGLVPDTIRYEELRAFFEANLEPDLHLYKEYHGLIVWTGKDFCRKTPRCAECPLGPLLPGGCK
jgi:endonuclease-3 related protein